jgi:hypothetical protein
MSVVGNIVATCFHPEIAIFRNPPVEDAADGEADKSLRLPCEMHAQLNLYLIFNRGGAYFSGVNLRNYLFPPEGGTRNSLISLTLRKIANF